jgi:hypothetical protein
MPADSIGRSPRSDAGHPVLDQADISGQPLDLPTNLASMEAGLRQSCATRPRSTFGDFPFTVHRRCCVGDFPFIRPAADETSDHPRWAATGPSRHVIRRKWTGFVCEVKSLQWQRLQGPLGRRRLLERRCWSSTCIVLTASTVTYDESEYCPDTRIRLRAPARPARADSQANIWGAVLEAATLTV